FLHSEPSNYKGTYEQIIAATNSHPKVHYSIVTLNYDRIPEMVSEFIHRHMQLETQFDFVREPGAPPTYLNSSGLAPALAKLHGSTDSRVIVPPTWNKSLNNDISPAWRLAHERLAEATQIRIIGYSLPIADAYVKYLLKSAVIKDPHLKRIDVICRDSTGLVEERYEQFMKFNFFKFVNANVTYYLQAHVKQYERASSSYNPIAGFAINRLEEAHTNFMQSAS
ncbi:MAG TPA: hypothetical protein VGE04_01110, partial [Chloroflexia bacterium]